MKTTKKGVLFDMLKQLEKYCTADTVAIPCWETYDGDYLGDGSYQFHPESTVTLTMGDHWKARYDCARIFKSTVTLPESYKGKKVYLNLDFGGEIFVKIDGKIANSVSSREGGGWVGRDKVNIPESYLKFGTPMEIVLEACVDSAGFCDQGMAGVTECEYTLKFAYFSLCDEICEKFYLNCVTVWEALDFINDEFTRESVYKVFDDALHIVEYDFDDKHTRQSIYAACEHFEKEFEKIKYTAQSEVIMDGHSHIDIAWLWRVQETQRKVGRTFANNLALMDVYPDFTFTQSQAIVYQMAKDLYPELYERIKAKVKNGQWNIVGNTWVECDTNIASGESMIRQLLYGKEFFQEEFGVSSDTYWLPDCFGFSHALPQIIKKSGMKYFITTKLLNQDTNRFPHTVFKWKGHDGSEILALNQRSHYQGDYDPAQVHNASYNNDLKHVLKTAFGMYGYGDGGGGSTYRMLENAKRLQNFPGLPATRSGHPAEFFAKVEEIKDELPTYNDELYYENHRGTYTSQGFIKKGNRKGEFLLTRIEMAKVFGGGYNTEDLKAIWRKFLTNQFHDILPGTSIHEAMQDSVKEFGEILNDAASLYENEMASLSADIKASKDGVAVWNMLAQPQTGAVKVKGTYALGETYKNYTENGEAYTEFIAENVPSMGYKFFPYGEIGEVKASGVASGKGFIENEILKVEFDKNGILTSVFDKEHNRETLAGEGNLLAIFTDKCIHETAWNLEQNYEKKKWVLREAESVEIIECSPLKAVLRVVRKFNKSSISQDIILYKNSRQLLFKTNVDWQERDKVLKAAFNIDVLNTEATFEAAHGAIKRPTHRNSSFDAARYEQCAHKWADLSEGDYGVSILNDCKYGYDILDNCMRITLLRAPTCPDPKGDLGSHEFTYSYYPHQGTWQTGGTVKEAFLLNMPLTPVKLTANSTDCECEKSFLSCDNEDIVIDAVKAAQNGEGTIIRLYQSRRVRGQRTLTVNLPFTRAYECNLMEDENEEIAFEGNKITFNIKPFEVKTFRII